MTDAEIARMGEYARQALDNPALSEALKRLHELALEQFKRTDIRDAEGLKLARQFAAVTDDFETILKRMVEGGRGVTFIPELAVKQLTEDKRKLVRSFAIPTPTRHTIIITRRNFIRKSILKLITADILKSIPADMLKLKPHQQKV